MLQEFKKFLLRGNVVDLAVGVVIGASFGTVVTALVSDIITPLIAAIAKVPDFSDLALTLNDSQLMYGHFLNAIISFVLVAAVIFFFIVKPINVLVARTKKDPLPDPATKKCPECLGEIPIGAKRCMHCAQIVVV